MIKVSNVCLCRFTLVSPFQYGREGDIFSKGYLCPTFKQVAGEQKAFPMFAFS